MRFVAVGDWGRQGHDQQRAVGVAMGRAAELHRSSMDAVAGRQFLRGRRAGHGRSAMAQLVRGHLRRAVAALAVAGDPRQPRLSRRRAGAARLRQRATRAGRCRRATTRRTERSCRRHASATCSSSTPTRSCRATGTARSASMGRIRRHSSPGCERGLAASRAAWKIVIGHHPIHTADGAPTEEPELIAVPEAGAGAAWRAALPERPHPQPAAHTGRPASTTSPTAPARS